MLTDECFDITCYLMIVPVHVLIATAGTIVGLKLKHTRPDLSRQIIKGSWILMAALFVSGLFFTECWNHLVYGRFYIHHDYMPGVDCSPFWFNPQWQTTYLQGMTSLRLVALWSVYALICWGTALALTWLLIKRRKTNHSEQPVPGCHPQGVGSADP